MRLAWLILLMGGVCAASAPPGEWCVRDVAAGTAWLGPDTAEAGLRLDADRLSCAVIDTTGGERAVTLAYCIALDATGGTWWDDPERSRHITGEGQFTNSSDNAGGLNNQASLYPLSVVVAGGRTICLAVPPEPARLPRFIYDATLRELRAEFDFGLSPEPRRFKSRADARVIVFEIEKKGWAFRRALAHYYELYPRAFTRRVKSAGIWFPFADIRAIANPRDFGFAFHEIAAEQVSDLAEGRKLVEFDHSVGCGDYVYVEPPTYWQVYRGKGKGTHEERLAQLQDEAGGGLAVARATLVSGIIRADGRRDLYLGDVAYTPLRPWGSDANPLIADGKGQYEFDRLEPLLGWRDRPNIGLDGVYVDSMEGWGEILNYNREHWRVSEYPLTFDPATKKVCLLNFWGTVSWVKEMSSRLHARGKLLMGNDAFFRRWQLAPYVDIPGREYAWLEGDAFKPVPDDRYLFLRAMAARRPYLMLMNNRYERGEHMEEYFQRCLFYAVFPSMFHAHASQNEAWYFGTPAWYERDRPLFRKYIPLIRKLDEAGWEPFPLATAEPATTRIERYGRIADGNLAFAIHNTSGEERAISLTLSGEFSASKKVAATEWIANRPVVLSNGRLSLTLPPDGYAVVSLSPG